MTYREQVAEAAREVEVAEAAREVEDAIDLLNAQPQHYGGHLAKDYTSTIDGSALRGPIFVMHDDGRVGRLHFGEKPNGRHEPNAATVTFRDGVTRVVPARKLRHLT